MANTVNVTTLVLFYVFPLSLKVGRSYQESKAPDTQIQREGYHCSKLKCRHCLSLGLI